MSHAKEFWPLCDNLGNSPPDTGSGDPDDDGGGTDIADDPKAGSFEGEE